MKKTHILFLLSLLAWSTVGAKDIKIDKYRYAGPFKVSTPLMIDSIGVNSEKFDITSLLDTPLQIDLADNGQDFSASSPLSSGSSTAIHLLQFSLENSVFAKADLKLEGLKHYRLFPSAHLCLLSPHTATNTLEILDPRFHGSQPNCSLFLIEGYDLGLLH